MRSFLYLIGRTLATSTFLHRTYVLFSINLGLILLCKNLAPESYVFKQKQGFWDLFSHLLSLLMSSPWRRIACKRRQTPQHLWLWFSYRAGTYHLDPSWRQTADWLSTASLQDSFLTILPAFSMILKGTLRWLGSALVSLWVKAI